MGKLFNSINKGFSRIFRVLLFVLSAFLIIYFFPKSGKFKYNFENGRPWQSENLYAPLDFAIEKSSEQLGTERQLLIDKSDIYFELNKETSTNVKNSFDAAFNNIFNDSLISVNDKNQLFELGNKILDSFYSYGILDGAYNYDDERNIVII